MRLSRSSSISRKPERILNSSSSLSRNRERPGSAERSGRKRLELSKERPRAKLASGSEFRQNRFVSRPKSPETFLRPEMDLDLDSSHDSIDKRLANLQEFLQNALK